MVENLVRESDFKIIFETLIRTQLNKDSVMLWQLGAKGERVVRNAVLTKIKTREKFIILKSLNGKNIGFDKRNSIFIRCQDRGLLFKGEIKNVLDNDIQIKVPEEVHIIENRESARNEMVTSPAVRIVLEKANDEIVGQTRFEFAIQNISTTGAAVFFSVSKLKSFALGNELVIKSIGNVIFEVPHKCAIVYLKEVEGPNEGLSARYHKMGLKFQYMLSETKLLDILENYGM